MNSIGFSLFKLSVSQAVAQFQHALTFNRSPASTQLNP